MSTNLAFGAGGPQRRKSIPTAARLAQLRHRAIKARMQGLGSGRREGRTLLAVDQDVPQIINERTSRNLANTFPFVGGNRGLPRDILSLRHNAQQIAPSKIVYTRLEPVFPWLGLARWSILD